MYFFEVVSMKSYLTSLFFCMILFSSATSQELNLNMEDVDAYAQPVMWKIGHDPEQAIVYRLLSDSVVKHSGRYSLKIFTDSKRAQFGSCFMLIPLTEIGKTVTLKGFLKSENIDKGSGSLFMALINDSITLQYDNMLKSGSAVTGTKDWKEFTITLPCSEDVTKISFGGLLVGTGTLWIDDLSLMVDDKKITNAPLLHPEFKDPKTGKTRKFK